jgi:DNA primase
LTRTIPDTTITQIRRTADIVDVVSESVHLRKAGKDFSGLCPFHSEKTPSFSVSPDKQLFYCFGCGEGGDVFHFVMRREGFPFAEAVRFLARRCGIEIGDRAPSPEEAEKAREQERTRWILREAADWFRKQLVGAPEGRPARAYLDRRGVNSEMRERFALGYAPDAWDRLLAHLGKAGVPAEVVERAGLALPRKSGTGHYDRFRGRVVFPIMDGRGSVVAFGGRVLGAEKPKYLNSPETDLFRKREALYGQHAARRSARETGVAFVVEGYLDVITLHQFGIANAVATLGTALTAGHVRLLRSMTERAVLVFDADEAGLRAAERSVPVFAKAQMPASVLLLEPGTDPDAFVRERGADAFRERAEAAPEGIPFLADRFLSRYGDTVAGKARAAAELAPVLSGVADPVARPLYVSEVAARLGAPESAVWERMGKAPADPAPPAAPRRLEPAPAASGREAGSASRRWRLERMVTAMLLQYPPSRSLAGEREFVDGMGDERLRAIAAEALRRPEGGADEIAAALGDAAHRRLAASLAFAEEEWTPEVCRNLFAQLRGRRPRGPDPLLQRIEEARRSNDPALLQELLREKMRQSQRRKGGA